MVETLAGRIPVSISGVSNSLPHVKAGRIVPLLVTDARRHPLYPDVPSVTEAGIPEAALSVWFGVYSTGGTPGAILTRLNAEINAALRQADVAAKLAAQGFDPMGGPASRLADLQRRERPIYAKVIRDAGMKVE
jgi:tripartite-type tricarboxylate transporter receptor subunit TctC